MVGGQGRLPVGGGPGVLKWAGISQAEERGKEEHAARESMVSS